MRLRRSGEEDLEAIPEKNADMRHENISVAGHGFVGHLAEPDAGSDRAVIVVMGGEKSLLPGIKFAERFADFGITGLAVSLFGAEGLPDSPDRLIPLIGLMYRTFGKYRRENIDYFEQSEKAIITWIGEG